MMTDSGTYCGYAVGQDPYGYLERVYGTEVGGSSSGPCLQNCGSVETKDGRLSAFPNVVHHRVSPFELVDKTRPGHRRVMVLWLVDPYTRVISTANVPPQQRDCLLDNNVLEHDGRRGRAFAAGARTACPRGCQHGRCAGVAAWKAARGNTSDWDYGYG